MFGYNAHGRRRDKKKTAAKMKVCLGFSDTRNYRKNEETHVKQDLSTYVKTVEIERDVRKLKKRVLNCTVFLFKRKSKYACLIVSLCRSRKKGCAKVRKIRRHCNFVFLTVKKKRSIALRGNAAQRHSFYR